MCVRFRGRKGRRRKEGSNPFLSLSVSPSCHLGMCVETDGAKNPLLTRERERERNPNFLASRKDPKKERREWDERREGSSSLFPINLLCAKLI